jgi:hypothetical protein
VSTMHQRHDRWGVLADDAFRLQSGVPELRGSVRSDHFGHGVGCKLRFGDVEDSRNHTDDSGLNHFGCDNDVGPRSPGQGDEAVTATGSADSSWLPLDATRVLISSDTDRLTLMQQFRVQCCAVCAAVTRAFKSGP